VYLSSELDRAKIKTRLVLLGHESLTGSITATFRHRAGVKYIRCDKLGYYTDVNFTPAEIVIIEKIERCPEDVVNEFLDKLCKEDINLIITTEDSNMAKRLYHDYNFKVVEMKVKEW